jgi:hypothetical protein
MKHYPEVPTVYTYNCVNNVDARAVKTESTRVSFKRNLVVGYLFIFKYAAVININFVRIKNNKPVSLCDISSSHGGEYEVKIEAARTSETSVDNYFTRQYIPEDKSELFLCVLIS